FRGVIFRITEESLGTWIALAISSLLFGGAHLLNPHSTLAAASAIAIEAGLLLGAAYVLTRSLWLGIAIHAAWNFAEEGLFGVADSGQVSKTGGLLIPKITGPTVLTGGIWGPEMSIVAVLLCTTAGIALLMIA